MATFLLEIGSEELPADFARLALPQLEQQVRHSLAAQRLSHGLVRSDGTPRRLAVRVEDLPERQADLEEERKGPPAAQAFQDGRPSAAAIGFARRCGVDPQALVVRETAKGPFLFACSREPGRPTATVLADEIPRWIEALQGRRFMRWGSGECRFSRPIRWLVALLDDDCLPVRLESCDPVITADRHSRGHRLGTTPVPIGTARAYEPILEAAGVQVNRERRARWIRQQVLRAAATANARPELPDDLFEELVDLVESPSLIEGAIEERFLALPPEVLSTVMRAHQRYVPLHRLDAQADPLALTAEGSLLPRFLCIGNGLTQAEATVRRGNERVLRARLADAEFFLAADRAIPCEERLNGLARVTFAEGLGSLRERAGRLEWLTQLLAGTIGLDSATAATAARAAHLCKHDLVSQMVGEFPELQGVIGAKYALAEGEPRAVALAVLEHYLPRSAGDELPASEPGAVVALAERLELLLSIFAKGERPSGSSDPYALRRAGNGLLQILWRQNWRLDLLELLARSAPEWRRRLTELTFGAETLAAELAEFLRQRLISLLEEEGFAPDLVQAVAGETIALDRVLTDPCDVRRRLELLAELRRDGRLAGVQAVVQRAARLAEKGTLADDVLAARAVVDPGLFSSVSEQGMLAVLHDLEPIVTGADADRYRLLAEGLARSSEALAAFFDGSDSVMVMVEDTAVRTNRLNLLGILRNQASVLADFSRITG